MTTPTLVPTPDVDDYTEIVEPPASAAVLRRITTACTVALFTIVAVLLAGLVANGGQPWLPTGPSVALASAAAALTVAALVCWAQARQIVRSTP